MPERLRASLSSGMPLHRVLFATLMDPSQKFGSFEEQTFALAREFHARDGLFLPLYVAPLGPRVSAAYQAEGLSAESLDLRTFRPGTLFQLARLVKTYAIDVVHWNFFEPVKNGYVWGLSLLAPKVRHYFTDHNSRFAHTRVSGGGPQSVVKRAINRRYDQLFCVSDFVARSLQGPDRWENIRRWTLFVNTERFCPSPEARRALRDQHGGVGEFVALVVAYLIPEKGVDVVIRAFHELDGPSRLWIVGEGPERAKLEALARELAIEDRVTFFGMQWDVAPFMQAADCLVCPSLWAEAAGFVNVEGQACGLPVVASRTGGIPEHVEDGRTGMLVPPGDAPAIARALRQLQSEPDALQVMSAEARSFAVDRFSIRERIHEFLEFYTISPGALCHDREHRNVDPARAPA
jgi:L-malate glycosyltransferase